MYRRRIYLYRRKGEGRHCFLKDRIQLITCHLSYSLNRPGAIHPFLYIILFQNSQRGKEFNKFCLSNSWDDLCIACLNPSSMVQLPSHLSEDEPKLLTGQWSTQFVIIYPKLHATYVRNGTKKRRRFQR